MKYILDILKTVFLCLLGVLYSASTSFLASENERHYIPELFASVTSDALELNRVEQIEENNNIMIGNFKAQLFGQAGSSHNTHAQNQRLCMYFLAGLHFIFETQSYEIRKSVWKMLRDKIVDATSKKALKKCMGEKALREELHRLCHQEMSFNNVKVLWATFSDEFEGGIVSELFAAELPSYDDTVHQAYISLENASTVNSGAIILKVKKQDANTLVLESILEQQALPYDMSANINILADCIYKNNETLRNNFKKRMAGCITLVDICARMSLSELNSVSVSTDCTAELFSMDIRINPLLHDIIENADSALKSKGERFFIAGVIGIVSILCAAAAKAGISCVNPIINVLNAGWEACATFCGWVASAAEGEIIVHSFQSLHSYYGEHPLMAEKFLIALGAAAVGVALATVSSAAWAYAKPLYTQPYHTFKREVQLSRSMQDIAPVVLFENTALQLLGISKVARR